MRRARLLLITEEGLIAKEFELRDPSILIGCSPESKVLIQSNEIDRSHAQILSTKQGFFITDLGSENGTYLNGNRLQPRKIFELHSEDRLMLGQIKLVFQSVSESMPLVTIEKGLTIQAQRSKLAESVVFTEVEQKPAFEEVSNEVILIEAQPLSDLANSKVLLKNLLRKKLQIFEDALSSFTLSDNADLSELERLLEQSESKPNSSSNGHGLKTIPRALPPSPNFQSRFSSSEVIELKQPSPASSPVGVIDAVGSRQNNFSSAANDFQEENSNSFAALTYRDNEQFSFGELLANWTTYNYPELFLREWPRLVFVLLIFVLLFFMGNALIQSSSVFG